VRIAGDAGVRGVVVPSRGGTVFRQVGGPAVRRGLDVSRHSGLGGLRIVLDDARLHLSPLAVGIYPKLAGDAAKRKTGDLSLRGAGF
jgi:hypothetical protein